MIRLIAGRKEKRMAREERTMQDQLHESLNNPMNFDDDDDFDNDSDGSDDDDGE